MSRNFLNEIALNSPFCGSGIRARRSAGWRCPPFRNHFGRRFVPDLHQTQPLRRGGYACRLAPPVLQKTLDSVQRRFPWPTSTRVPTMTRTMWRKNPPPLTSMCRSSPSAQMSTEKTSRTVSRALQPAARKAAKSWRPTRRVAAFSIACRSRGARRCQEVRASRGERAGALQRV